MLHELICYKGSHGARCDLLCPAQLYSPAARNDGGGAVDCTWKIK